VVEFGFPTTPTKERATDCVGVRAKGVNANGLILAIDLGKFKNVAEETMQSLGVSRHDFLGQGLGSSRTQSWNKITVRRIFRGLRDRHRAVLPRSAPELDAVARRQ
jgi:hypothetical protein